MLFVGKKLIEQYEQRIADLKKQHEQHVEVLTKQLTDFRSLVLPQVKAYTIPASDLEADAVMSGRDEIIQLSKEELKELEESMSERDRILSGTY